MPNCVNARSGGIVKTRGSPVLFYTLSFHCFLKSAFFLESKKTKAYQGHPKPDKDSYNPLLFSYELDEKHSIVDACDVGLRHCWASTDTHNHHQSIIGAGHDWRSDHPQGASSHRRNNSIQMVTCSRHPRCSWGIPPWIVSYTRRADCGNANSNTEFDRLYGSGHRFLIPCQNRREADEPDDHLGHTQTLPCGNECRYSRK